MFKLKDMKTIPFEVVIEKINKNNKIEQSDKELNSSFDSEKSSIKEEERLIKFRNNLKIIL